MSARLRRTAWALSAVAACGCRSADRLAVEPAEAERWLRAARQELTVLPLFVPGSPSSCFPVSPGNVVCAAHALGDWFDSAAVQGRPMMLGHLYDESNMGARPPDRDWTVLHSGRDWLHPVTLDAAVKLNIGDLVIVGGFRAGKPPYDAAWHSGRAPEYVLGRVVPPPRNSSLRAGVHIAVPPGDYHGFSGGPAAIVDRDGHVRVWGVEVCGDGATALFPWNDEIIYAARLPANDLYVLKNFRLGTQKEADATLPRPASRPSAASARSAPPNRR